jgi:hypothetical protein
MPTPNGFRINPARKTGDRHDERGADIAQQHKQHAYHQKGADEDRTADSAERASDQNRLVVHDTQLHAFRQAFLNILHGFAYALRKLHGVRAELLDDAATHHFAAQPVCNAAAHRGCFAYLGDIPERDRRRAVNSYHRFSQIVHRLNASHSPNRPLHRTPHEETARRVQIGPFGGLHDFRQRHAPRRHAVRIELYLELAQVSAQAFDRGYTGNREQPDAHIKFREVPERHQVRRTWFGFEGELEDFIQASRNTRDQGSIGSRRQLVSRLAHTLGNELPRAIVVGLGLEFDRHLRDAQLRVGTNPLRVRQPRERCLHRNRDTRLQLFRSHRRILDNDVEHWGGQIRENISAQFLQPHGTERSPRQYQGQGKSGTAE